MVLTLHVIVEKIRVQRGLNQPTGIHHKVMMIVLLCIGSIDLCLVFV